MCDFLGNKLEVGDKVVYLQHTRTSSHLVKGTVLIFTPKMVTVRSDSGFLTSKSPDKMVKYTTE